MKKKNMRGKAILLIVVYSILFLLPLTLNQYILDYTFNFALAQLTLSLFLLMYDFDTFAYQIKYLNVRFTKQLLLFLLGCCVFAVLFLIHFTSNIQFTNLFTKASDVPALLVFMERFAIYFCLHLNEFYIFQTIRSQLSEKWERKVAAPVTFVIFVAFHLLLSFPFGMEEMLSQSIYYVMIGGTLMVMNYFNSSYFLYVLSAFIMLMLFSAI